MKLSKIQLSIGITAYNEEYNIRQVINSVINQKSDNYFLKEIIVIADGCTDRTVALIKLIPDKRINLIIGKKRQGQSECENKLLELYRGDAILIIEADVQLASTNTINACVNAYYLHPRSALIYGQAKPLPGYNYYGNAISCIETIRQKYLMQFHQGNNIYTLQHFKMLTKKFTSNFRWPSDAHDDTYLYAYCEKYNYNHLFVKTAIVYYCSPASLQDYINKSQKFRTARDKLQKYFPRKLIQSLYRIPKKVIINILAEGLIKMPLYTLIYLSSYVIARLAKNPNQDYSPLWETAITTKNLIFNQKHETA